MVKPEQATFRTAWGGAGLITIGTGPRAAMTWDPGTCRGCALRPEGEISIVPWCQGHGPVTASVAVVGQNPAWRAKKGVRGAFSIPYLAVRDTSKVVGSCRAFRDLAQYAKIDLKLVYSTNAVKCATPNNAVPSPQDAAVCVRTHLKSELRRLPHLRKVLAFGAVAGRALGVTKFGIGYAPDGWFPELVEVGVFRHPNWNLRQPGALEGTAARIREFLGPYALIDIVASP